MKKENRNTMILILVIILLIFVLAFIIMSFFKTSDVQDDEIEVVKESTDINVEYSETELTGEWENYVAKITLSNEKINIEGSGVSNSQNQIIISKKGTYYITGSTSNASIVVEATKEDDVQLVLDNCDITSTSSAAINGVKCNTLTLTLVENSENVITDANTYTIFSDTENTEPDGAIFTKSDLVINGTGTLKVNANYGDGIVSKDGLKIINANLEINSVDDGIRGKDYVAINNATLNINSTGDGVKSTNTEDTSLGYIAISGGNITIQSQQDGIQAETILNISENANINIKTNGTIANKTNTTNQYGRYSASSSTQTEDNTSSKGIKAGTEITIENANIVIDSTDDSIHSNGIIIINNGEFKLSSGDDGIHADTNIIINSGKIEIAKSYEGIESSYIEINGGEISIVASDDGINVAGGNDNSSVGGRVGQNNFSNVSNSNIKLVVNEGNITVDATGDGLDSNGSIYINGGYILVKGTSNAGNGALDYDTECIISGGDIIIYGAVGMWQNPSSNSTQNVLVYQVSGSSGDEILVKDSSGNIISSLELEKNCGAIIISNENIKTGDTYTLYKNNAQVGSIKSSTIISTYGNAASTQMNQPGRGF